MSESGDPVAPRRFRRRLTAAFVLVAAVSAGVVAIVTFVLARQYRWDAARAEVREEAQFAVAVAPVELDGDSFERFRRLYERRGDADIVAIRGENVFSSSTNLGVEDVPSALADLDDEPSLVSAPVDDREMLVAGARDENGVDYYFYFSLQQLRDSLDELARAAALSWLVTLVIAAAVGRFVSRRTLRPVARAASAATAIAAGDLSTRLPADGSDEFGTLAASFNHMADEVEVLISRLSAAADRERQFTADVAHELRTPLTGLAASAALLRDQLDALPDRARAPAEIIVADVERLRDLALDLLEVARLDAAIDPPTVTPLRVGAAVEAVVAAADPRRRADVRMEMGGEMMILAEPVALRHILSNLIDNAIVHGGGTVHVVARRIDGSAQIDIADEGPGISATEVTKIFDRFHKSDQSRGDGGTGLGLAIARQHAVRLGGTLSASNVRPHGARFSLVLPAAPADAALDGVTRP